LIIFYYTAIRRN